MQLQVETQIYKKDAIGNGINAAGTKADYYITYISPEKGIQVHNQYTQSFDKTGTPPYGNYVQINGDDISMWRANKEKMRLDATALNFYGYNDNNQHLLASYGDGLVLYKPGVGSGADTPVVSINSSGANIDGSVTIGGKIQGDYLNSNIQVGGNNLLIGTAASISKSTTATTSYVTQALYSTSDLKMLSELGFSVDDEITLSFDWKITSASTYGNARIEWYGKTDSANDTYIAPLIYPFATFSASNTSGHVEKTVKLTSATIQAKRLVLRIDNSNLTLTISNLKLEKGNKATSWSPAPEDLEKSYYGNCETAAATADKQVSCAGFNLKTGAIVGIKFTNGNTCESNITLNINGTGAKMVYFLGQTTGTDSRLNVSLAANAVVSVIYDGTYWRILSIDQTSTMITRIGDNGISIHPSGTTQHRVEINSSGMNVYRNNTSIAEYGTNARIGSANGQRFLINAGSLQAYDNNSNMYFEVSSAGIKFGQNIQVATTGDIPTKVSELDNDEDYVTNSEMEGSIQKAKGNYTILWNYDAFGTANNGEAFICKLDGLSNTASDSNGTVVWNGIERTITKQMVNPNAIAPYNIPIYIVCRLSNASATTATNYMVWYNDGWKYAICPTPSAIGGTWTWDNSRDIIIGKFVETGSEVALVEYEVYNPPLNSKQLTTINTTASSAAQTATNYISFDDSNGLRIAQSTSDFSKPYVQITSNGVKTIYNNNYFTNLTSSGLNIHAGNATNPIATYGATIVFFEPGTTTKAAEITSSGINIKAGTIKLGEYFEVSTTGTLTALAGKIGDFTLSNGKLYSGSHSTYNAANSGVYIGSDYVAGGSGAVWYFKNDGSAKIGAITISSTGAITVPADTFSISSVIGLQTSLNGKALSGAENTAKSYLDYDANNGLRIAQSSPSSATTNMVQIKANDIRVYGNSTNGYTKITSSGMEVFANINNTATNIASFGASARIGKDAEGKVVVTNSGIDMYGYDANASPKQQLLCHIGYGNCVTDEGTAYGPYYSFGLGRTWESGTNGLVSMAEGYFTKASGFCAHAEGFLSEASKTGAHAEGSSNATAAYAHAEGDSNASGEYSHAEGSTNATANYAHSEGYLSSANGVGSHAEGNYTRALGNYSHTSGVYTSTGYEAQFAIGKYNRDDSDYIFMVGNGSSSKNSNAFAVTKNGTIIIGDHSSSVGSVLRAKSSVTSLANDTATALCNLSIPAGTWILVGKCRFGGKAGNVRRLVISTTSADVTFETMAKTDGTGTGIQVAPGTSSAAVQHQVTHIVSVTANTPFYFNAWHNAGSALAIAVAQLEAVRIC